MRHPAYRIVSFLLLVALAVRGGSLQLLFVGTAVMGAYVVTGCSLRAATRTLVRARWLFLSIVIVYLWFTPGTAIFATALPTWEGLTLGAHRAGVLALVIFMANLLVQASSKEDLLAGLYGLTAPLARLGFPRERFAVRAALTLDYATRLREGSPEPGAEAVACEGSRVSRLEARLQRRYSEAVARARSTTAKSIDLPAPAPAGAGDYLLVGLLALAVLVW